MCMALDRRICRLWCGNRLGLGRGVLVDSLLLSGPTMGREGLGETIRAATAGWLASWLGGDQALPIPGRRSGGIGRHTGEGGAREMCVPDMGSGQVAGPEIVYDSLLGQRLRASTLTLPVWVWALWGDQWHGGRAAGCCLPTAVRRRGLVARRPWPRCGPARSRSRWRRPSRPDWDAPYEFPARRRAPPRVRRLTSRALPPGR
jgi:hypothetical protein